MSVHLTLPDIMTSALILVVPADTPVANVEYEGVVSGEVTVATEVLDDVKRTSSIVPEFEGIDAGNSDDDPTVILCGFKLTIHVGVGTGDGDGVGGGVAEVHPTPFTYVCDAMQHPQFV